VARSPARGQSLAPLLRLSLGPVLFNIFTNYLHDGTEHTLSRLADKTKSEGAADRPDGCTATQRDPGTLKKWAQSNLMKFKGKYDAQLLGRITPSTTAHWEVTGWKAA